MDLNKGNLKKIRGLILFTAVVWLAVLNMDVVLHSFFFLLGIVRPFIYGAAIAFVLNIPMKAIEKGLFSKAKSSKTEKIKRPVSIFLSFLSVILVIVIVTVTVIPQVTRTMIELGNKIPQFLVDAQIWLEELFASQPQLLAMLEEFEPAEINWDSIVNTIIDFMQNGLGNVALSMFLWRLCFLFIYWRRKKNWAASSKGYCMPISRRKCMTGRWKSLLLQERISAVLLRDSAWKRLFWALCSSFP